MYCVRNGKSLASMLAKDIKAANRLLAPITYWDDHSPILEAVTHFKKQLQSDLQ